ncbi:hypothetical protein UA08_03332 [Talaromyces atroroseus]|uniref:Inner centromere protein ARK-binding domain-containing protein n=1 Tax=Talaromyces atroroseus TaxID=1441469 RepID=A0A225AKU1_TALAT|nr:hypothetical protein UA08_03332 [Talaromyces atroroseus]OKL61500.1 hypothetical protein UA08_03332 [Talaromyces atroroseus]
MAAAGKKTIGSAAWIAAEKENVTRLLEQEMEEVEFPVRHEMDWLNEHMAEIFLRNQFNMTEIFKTPGKMRGKTPRTARKRNPDEARVPLSDIFSTANQRPKSPSKSAKSPEKPVAPQMPSKQATDPLSREPVDGLVQEPIKNPPEKPMDTSPEKPVSYPALDIKGKQPIRDVHLNKALNSFSTFNTDSGYHGLGDDDELVLPSTQPLPDTQVSADSRVVVTAPTQPPELGVVHNRKSLSMDRRTTEGSFVSAQENIISRGQTVEPMDIETDHQEKADEDTPRPLVKAAQEPRGSLVKPIGIQRETHVNTDRLGKNGDIVIDDNFDDIGSPSDGSTPARPLVRKSSLSFASLPAREPLMTKKSIGPRVSRTSHVDIIKPTAIGRQSYFTGQIEGVRPVVSNTAAEKEETRQENMDRDRKGRPFQQGETAVAYDTSALHSPRTTKSTAPVSHVTNSQVNYPELPGSRNDSTDIERVPSSISTSQESWIKPLGSPQKSAMAKSQTADIIEFVAGNETVGNLEKSKITRTETFHDLSNRRPPTPKRTAFPSFDQHQSMFAATPPSPHRSESSAQPVSNTAVESTTPVTSPRRLDGMLSGSKSRFQSIMKSAQGLFSSSASISAAAKLETLSPSASRPQPNLQRLGTSPERSSPSPEKLPTPKRSATEAKSNTAVKQTQLEDPFEVEEPRTRQAKATEPSTKLGKLQKKVQSKEPDAHETVDLPSSNQAMTKKNQRTQPQVRKEAAVDTDTEPKFPLPPSSSHAQTQPARQRPVKPMREATQKPKPQPMSIRVGSTLRMPVPSAASYSQEPISGPTPVSAKQPTLSKKASNSSLQTMASNTSFKSSISSQSQRRAQVAAAAESKKQEERDALLRKEEQKKRAAQQKQQQEELRRQDRERPVADEKKKSAQQRLENARIRQGSQPPRPANDLGSSIQQEKTTQRADMGPARPPSRLGSSMQSFSRSINQPPTNPAKPAKRHLEDESQHRPPASASQNKSQTAEAKRRKTEDEYNQQLYSQPATSLKQQPIRNENGKLSLLAHAYPQAPPPAAHHQIGGSLYKTGPVQPGAAGQQPKHAAPIDMTQYTSGKIPSAANNATAHKTPSHKTPNPGPSAQRVPAKASPQYPPSESIHLPEPPTDSEDEDSDADMMPVADWAQGSALTEALSIQETWPVDWIFGPVPDFSMEDAFKQDKKVKKFRERTSSANWSGPDGLTQDEITRDMAARRIMRANGGWSYNVS